jgi:hypothetical protein
LAALKGAPADVSTDITRFLSVLTKRTTAESGKVQATTIAARVNVWASSDVMDSCPYLTEKRAAPLHHARHTLRFELHLVYVGACMRQLLFRLANERTETIIFIQNHLDRNTLPSTGGDGGVFLRALAEVAVENEQRDVEGGV